MGERLSTLRIHKWMWSRQHECVVEVLSRGHFPTTALVKLPDGNELEVDIDTLGDAK